MASIFVSRGNGQSLRTSTSWASSLFEAGKHIDESIRDGKRKEKDISKSHLQGSQELQGGLSHELDKILLRARRALGLGFELQAGHPSKVNWFVPIALLWVWSMCFDIKEVMNIFVLRALKKVNDCSGPRPRSRKSRDMLQFEHCAGQHCFKKTAWKAISTIFDLYDREKRGQVIEVDVGDMIQHVFKWDKDQFYEPLLKSQMRERKQTHLSLNHFSSVMLFIALRDPIAFVKVLYICDALGPFGVKVRVHSSNTCPTDQFIATMLHQTFDVDQRPSFKRKLKLGALRLGTDIVDETKQGVAGHGNSSVMGQSGAMLTVNADAACPEAKLVDYFCVLDTHQIFPDLSADVAAEIDLPEELPLIPRLRSVWPPKSEYGLEEQGFTVEDLADIRLLHEMAPLPDDLHTFCFDQEIYAPIAGTKDAQWMNGRKLTRIVLTDGSGTRRFGVLLTFYEKISIGKLIRSHSQSHSFDEKLLVRGMQNTWYAPTCICLLSRWPLFSTFESFLLQTLRISRSKCPLPLERYIAAFVNDTPVPPRGQTQVQTVLGDAILYVQRPPKKDLPSIDFSLAPLFKLRTSTILTVFSCLLREQKVVLCSQKREEATTIAESFRALLHPFELQSIYIPALPIGLLDFLYAPVPFFMSVDASVLDSCEYKRDIPLSPTSPTGHEGFENSFDFRRDVVSPKSWKESSSKLSSLRSPSLAPIKGNFSHRQASRAHHWNGNSNCSVVSIEPRDVVFIDLDDDRVLLPVQLDDTPLEVLPLPKPLRRRLHESLDRARELLLNMNDPCAEEVERLSSTKAVNFSTFACSKAIEEHAYVAPSSALFVPKAEQKRSEHGAWVKEVRSAFIEFHIRLLQNYKKYLVCNNLDLSWSFDKSSFLSDRASMREFCRQLLATQMFESFSSDAALSMNDVKSDRCDDIRVFDELILDWENKNKSGAARIYNRQRKHRTPILSSNDEVIVRTLTVNSANADTCTSGPSCTGQELYQYERFPDLSPQLMRPTAPKKHLLPIAKAQVQFFESEISDDP